MLANASSPGLPARRWTTTTSRTLGQETIASSAKRLSGNTDPRR
jgi:hypothetical protein